ncbi:MAG TPA: hypothetical protein VJR47_19530 [Stellaceae bacterium]|nr:hypothetical protein [Stellaceae bacterium]
MYVHVKPDFTVALEEAQDFKRFKLVIASPRGDEARLKSALAGIAELSNEGHAWISEAWLRRHDAAPAWQQGLDAMITVAKKYGWVDEQAKTIRAHVERPGDAPAKA